ncbi:MFS transporter [Saccharothrix sp. ALI-22-I]|uniref:MFS transporter n=1 Tax=Saccharothrix sp. ALI-22-I TaxID=1933778 RepID=UPI00097BC59C|nr:MFS transporter [Saccharothrix sp. ALI-22-I]ONI92544.1 MFS transporter [Saccharothrix sp. ALI-22-I]
MSSIAPPPAKATPRQWFGLAVLLLPVTLMTADLGVLWLATPYLAADLHPSSSQILWITDLYGFMTCGFLVVMGTLGDRIGRRKLLMLGSVGVIVASLLAAYSTSAETLIVARALLGVAGAAVLPSTLSLIIHMFTDVAQRTRAIAMWVTSLSVGLAIGPIVGGVLLQSFWWGSVFLIGVPIMLLPLILGPVILPEYRDPNAGRIDLLSVLLFLLGILPIIYAVKHLAEDGAGLVALLSAVVGIAFSVAFVRLQLRLPNPLLDMKLFANRSFTAALLTLLFGMMALNGVEYLVPQFMQMVSGLSPLAAGLWLVPGAVGLIAGSQLTPVLTRTVRPAHVITGGLAVALVGFALIYLSGAGTQGVWLSALGLTVVMFGVAPISVLGTTLAGASAPPEKAGSASATGQTAYDLGLALGIAITGSVAVAVYRSEVAEAVPVGTPADAAEATRDSIGSAVDAAAQLPAAAGEQLLATAREAFTDAFHSTALVSAGIAVLTAVIVLTLLKHVPPTGATPEAEPDPEPVPAEPVTASITGADGKSASE